MAEQNYNALLPALWWEPNGVRTVWKDLLWNDGELQQSGTLCQADPCYSLGWPQPHLSPALLPPAGFLCHRWTRRLWRWDRTWYRLMEKRQRRMDQRGFGIEEPRLIHYHWMLVGTIICIHLCHPGLSVATFCNCFCNSRLTFLREKKLPTD